VVALLEYLARLKKRSWAPVRTSLHEVATELSTAGVDVEKTPGIVEPLLREFFSAVNGREVSPSGGGPLKRLGIWLGFEHPTPLHREGIIRYLSYLVQHLIARHDIECELWCYSFNEDSVREGFRALLDEPRYARKIRIVHERNYRDVFASTITAYDRQPEVSIEKNNLYELANEVSRADCFLLGICYLDNALWLRKPVFVPLHDLVVLAQYHSFVGDNESFRPHARRIREAVEMFNLQGAFFFCNSDYVRREHLYTYLSHVDEQRTQVVYLPANVPPDIHRRLPPRHELLRRHGIGKPYFFYPTQIRANKNVLALLKALKQLRDEHCEAVVVLTGGPEHVPAVQRYIEDNRLAPWIVLAKDVSEETLYALHANAVATVVPTLLEGGFPWQGLEAMLMDTPAILSDIAVVSERLSAFGIDPAGLRLFPPHDTARLAGHMRDALVDRAAIVPQQRAVKEGLFRYTWDDVAFAYYATISKELVRRDAGQRPG
jgi:glycosyltransferase involved in cell wall biosynthesis